MQGNYVSQWCEFEFEDLHELVNKLENTLKILTKTHMSL